MLYHPRPMRLPDPPVPLFSDEAEPNWDTDHVRAYMRTHSRKPGDPTLSVNRTPFVGQLKTVTSPDDEEVEFTIKRCGVGENIARKNLASTIRYVQEEGSSRFVSEKDYPVGDLELETVFLGMHDWNLRDANGAPIKLTRKAISDYLSPAEFGLLHREILALNPLWSGSEDDVKND